MKTLPTIGKVITALMLGAAGVAWSAELAYESLNSGGASYATNGNVKLGASLGQSGFIWVGTNTARDVQSGFWKLENGCELYPVAISSFLRATGSVAITFNAMLSNVYTVAAIATEQGGPLGGTEVWTNLVATLTGAGGLGSVTTVYENVSVLTNAARFYLIRCESP